MTLRTIRTYDTELKQQMFMIRKDKEYKSSTKITAEVGTFSQPVDGKYTQHFNVTVYRAIGESTVEFYANDQLVKTITWEAGTTTMEIQVSELYINQNYDFKIIYTGNETCKSSQTPIIPVKYPQDYTPNLTVRFVKFNNHDQVVSRYYVGEDVGVECTLTDLNNVPIANKLIHCNGITLPTDSNGKIFFGFDKSMFSVGVLNFNIWTDADETMGAVSTTASISYGVGCEILQSPSVILQDVPTRYRLKVFDLKTLQPAIHDYIHVKVHDDEIDIYPNGLFVNETGEIEFIINELNISQIIASGDNLNVYLLKDRDETISQKIATIPVKVMPAPATINITCNPIDNEECIINTMPIVITMDAGNNVPQVPVKLYVDNNFISENITDNNGKTVFNNVQGDGYTVLTDFDITNFNKSTIKINYGGHNYQKIVPMYNSFLKLTDQKAIVLINMEYNYPYELRPGINYDGIYKEKVDPLIFYVPPNVSYTVDITGIIRTSQAEDITRSIGMVARVNWDGTFDSTSYKVGLNYGYSINNGRMIIHRDNTGNVNVYTNFGAEGMTDTMELQATYPSQQMYYPNLDGKEIWFKKVTITYHRE